jgi:hypothetical protein
MSSKSLRSISGASVADLPSFSQNVMETRFSILPSLAAKEKHEVEKALV